MAKLSTAELLDAFKELTLIELSEFVKSTAPSGKAHINCEGDRAAATAVAIATRMILAATIPTRRG